MQVYYDCLQVNDKIYISLDVKVSYSNRHRGNKDFEKVVLTSWDSIVYSYAIYNGEIETKDFLIREHGLNYEKKVYFYSTSKLDNRFDKQSGTGKRNDCNRDEILIL